MPSVLNWRSWTPAARSHTDTLRSRRKLLRDRTSFNISTLSLSPRILSSLSARPLVSLLVPSYNYAGFIREALQSALDQTHDHLEIIVCDDGSTDASCDIVAEMAAKDQRIQLLQQENAGVAAALNRAFDASRGEIICLLDADDRFHADKVRQVVELMQRRPQTGFVQHAMEVIDGAGHKIRQLPAHGLYEEGWLAEKLLARGGRLAQYAGQCAEFSSRHRQPAFSIAG